MTTITKTPFFESVDKMFEEILSEVPHSTVGNYDFDKDIVTGEQGQDFIKNYLISKGYNFISSNTDNKYDLLMSYNNKEITYEVKTDLFDNTGNIAIEFESRGKESGINVTKAEYFVTYFAKLREIWNIKTSDLKNLIQKNKFKIVNGGDKGSNTMIYLIKKEKFAKYFKIHKLTQSPSIL